MKTRTQKPAAAPGARQRQIRDVPCQVALVTAPDMATARRLARGALKARLIACANLVPRIESHYHWKGRLEKSSEVLVMMKTQPLCIVALREFILREHPYETAEFLALDVASGSEKYLAWIRESLG